MKAGQILSYTDESLPEEARRILATLQTHSAHVPFDRLRSVVLDELGTKGQALLSTMHRKPVAAASIGQVHRARLPSGPARPDERVAGMSLDRAREASENHRERAA